MLESVSHVGLKVREQILSKQDVKVEHRVQVSLKSHKWLVLLID